MALTHQGREHRTRIRDLKISELTAHDVAAWRELESNALEPNAYLSHHFLLPALRFLDPDRLTTLHFLERENSLGWELCAIVPLGQSPGDRHIPLSHYSVYHSIHTFMGGILVHRDDAEKHLDTIFQYWRKTNHHGVTFKSCHIDGPTERILSRIATNYGMRRLEIDVFERAMMHPGELGESDQKVRLPSRLKKIRTAKNKLAKIGPIQFITYRGREISDDVIERHIHLEHMGWKGENGSSLRSKPEHEKFFREMSRGFCNDNRGFIAELWAGDHLVHSSSNLTSGKTGFAFKVGFDPEFSQYSPGIMGELELMRCAPDLLADLEIVDSGSVAGSFIEELWPVRHRMATVVYATSSIGNLALAASAHVRTIKQRWALRRVSSGESKSDSNNSENRQSTVACRSVD